MIAALALMAHTPILLAETPAEHPGWRIINLLVFAGALIYIFVNKVKIGEILERRAASIKRDLEEARQEKEEAEQRLAQVAARLSKMDQELSEIKGRAESEAKHEVERLRQAALADAEKIQEFAKREIEGAVKAARAELRGFAADTAVETAEAIIKKAIKPEDNSRLISEYVDQLGEVKR